MNTLQKMTPSTKAKTLNHSMSAFADTFVISSWLFELNLQITKSLNFRRKSRNNKN